MYIMVGTEEYAILKIIARIQGVDGFFFAYCGDMTFVE